MSYTPTNFQDLPATSTPVTAAELNKLGSQYANAVADTTAQVSAAIDAAGVQLDDALAASDAQLGTVVATTVIDTADALATVPALVDTALTDGGAIQTFATEAVDTSLAAAGEITDAVVETVLTDPTSQSRQALDATIAQGLKPQASAYASSRITAAFQSPNAANTPAISVLSGLATYATTGSIAGAVLVREKRLGNVSTAALDLAGDTHFSYGGVSTVPPVAGFETLAVRPAVKPATGAPWTWTINVETTASEVEFKLRCPASTSFRPFISVNGLYVTEFSRNDTVPSEGTIGYKLTFPSGSQRKRRISITGFGGMGFAGAWCSTGAQMTRPPKFRRRVAIVSDSFGAGVGNAPTGMNSLESFGPRLAQLLGADDVVYGSAGGAGWLASAYPFSTRMTDVLATSPDIVVFLGSRNDGWDDIPALTEAVRSTVARAVATGAEVYVSGYVLAGVELGNNAVKAGAEAGGARFVDLAGTILGTGNVGAPTGNGNADWLIQADGIHPNFEGGALIANLYFTGIVAPA